MESFDLNTKENQAGKKKTDTRNIIAQMVDGIAGVDNEKHTKMEKEKRCRLAGRALEFMMFIDDDGKTDI